MALIAPIALALALALPGAATEPAARCPRQLWEDGSGVTSDCRSFHLFETGGPRWAWWADARIMADGQWETGELRDALEVYRDVIGRR